jgi:hypothetical protein
VAIQATTEFAATSPEVTHAIVEELRKSDRKYRVFEAVYSGGNKPKDATLLAKKTGLTEIAVLQLATPMAHKQYFEQVRQKGRVGFKKYHHINAVKQTILRGAKSTRPSQTKTLKSKRPTKTGSRSVPQSRNETAWKSKPVRWRRKFIYDVFVSHASEDKAFVGPLVKDLKSAGIKVWYDEDFLFWGDDLRGSIDKGLTSSRFGIVVFSKAFLKKKHWTEHELNGLFARERTGHRVILPIWHKITDKELLKYSPAFADRIAVISKRSSNADIVSALKKLLGRVAHAS